MRKSPSFKTYKLLYIRSGNECAFPDCKHPIFNDQGLYIANLCHIKAANKGGPRYDEQQSDEERRSNNNLLFLCHRHHKETDYMTVEELRNIKVDHEYSYTEEGKLFSNDMFNQIESEARMFWRNQEIKSNKFKEDDLKIITEIDVTEAQLYDKLLADIDFLYDIFTKLSISDSTERIEADIEKLLIEAGLDYSKIEKVPYYKNPFSSRNWESHNIALPNIFNQLKLDLYQLRVKTFENLLLLSPKNKELINELSCYREAFEKHYNFAFLID